MRAVHTAPGNWIVDETNLSKHGAAFSPESALSKRPGLLHVETRRRSAQTVLITSSVSSQVPNFHRGQPETMTISRETAVKADCTTACDHTRSGKCPPQIQRFVLRKCGVTEHARAMWQLNATFATYLPILQEILSPGPCSPMTCSASLPTLSSHESLEDTEEPPTRSLSFIPSGPCAARKPFQNMNHLKVPTASCRVCSRHHLGGIHHASGPVGCGECQGAGPLSFSRAVCMRLFWEVLDQFFRHSSRVPVDLRRDFQMWATFGDLEQSKK